MVTTLAGQTTRWVSEQGWIEDGGYVDTEGVRWLRVGAKGDHAEGGDAGDADTPWDSEQG